MEEKELEERKQVIKEKIISFLEDKDNLILFGVLFFAFFIRLYYFWITKTQPLWWDEAEYMLRAKAFVFDTPITGWAIQREIVVPLIWSVIYLITKSEFWIRFLQVIISLSTIFLTYLLGKEMFDKKIGIIAALIMAANGIHLFFTMRLLTYLWAPLFFLLTFYFFWKGYIKKEKRIYIYITPLVAAFGISIYGSLAFGVLTIFIFFIITEQHKFLLKKDIWIMAIIGSIALIPQFIYSKITYGSAISRWSSLQSSPSTRQYDLIFSYFKMFPHLFGKIFTLLIALGSVYVLYNLILSFDFILKNKSKNLKAYLLVFLWSFIVLTFYTYVAIYRGGTVYDAFVMSAFPALAIFGAHGASLIYKSRILNYKLSIFILIIILLLGGFYQISYANKLIINKINSFDTLKDAGLWLKQNSNPDDKILTQAVPAITCYSERISIFSPSLEDELQTIVNQNNTKFFVLSAWQMDESQLWYLNYSQKNPDKFIPLIAFPINSQQPTTIIYLINSSAF